MLGGEIVPPTRRITRLKARPIEALGLVRVIMHFAHMQYPTLLQVVLGQAWDPVRCVVANHCLIFTSG